MDNYITWQEQVNNTWFYEKQYSHKTLRTFINNFNHMMVIQILYYDTSDDPSVIDCDYFYFDLSTFVYYKKFPDILIGYIILQHYL